MSVNVCNANLLKIVQSDAKNEVQFFKTRTQSQLTGLSRLVIPQLPRYV